mgnify:CR=1 FL=1
MTSGIGLLKISAIYLAAGSLLGLFMGIRQDFVLTSVHVHVSLLGWLAFAVAGMTYVLIPACEASALARVHFLGHNIGFPVMMISLALYAYGFREAEKAIAVSSTVVVVSLLVFVANVLINAHKEP